MLALGRNGKQEAFSRMNRSEFKVMKLCWMDLNEGMLKGGLYGNYGEEYIKE